MANIVLQARLVRCNKLLRTIYYKAKLTELTVYDFYQEFGSSFRYFSCVNPNHDYWFVLY